MVFLAVMNALCVALNLLVIVGGTGTVWNYFAVAVCTVACILCVMGVRDGG